MGGRSGVACDVIYHVVWCFGGLYGYGHPYTYFSDLFSLKTVDHTLTKHASENGPSARSFASFVAEGNYLWLFGGDTGGSTSQSQSQNDLHRFDTINNVWEEVTAPWRVATKTSLVAWNGCIRW